MKYKEEALLIENQHRNKASPLMVKLDMKIMMWGDMADSTEIQVKAEGVYSNLETVKVEDLA